MIFRYTSFADTSVAVKVFKLDDDIHDIHVLSPRTFGNMICRRVAVGLRTSYISVTVTATGAVPLTLMVMVTVLLTVTVWWTVAVPVTVTGPGTVVVAARPASASIRQAAGRVEVRAAHRRTVAWRASGRGTRVF